MAATLSSSRKTSKATELYPATINFTVQMDKRSCLWDARKGLEVGKRILNFFKFDLVQKVLPTLIHVDVILKRYDWHLSARRRIYGSNIGMCE
jgi:hypothetical protein